VTLESPYPELKKTHIPERVGRPWRANRPPPAAPVWTVIQGFASYWLLVAAVELGAFDALARLGPVSIDGLADELGASPPHLGALLDGLVVLGLLDQVDERYELNEVAERYLTSSSPATMAGLVAVAPGPHANWVELANTVRSGMPANPIENSPGDFYRPLVRATFPTQHRAARRVAALIGWDRLSGAPRVLDLGAGGAPWTLALLEHPAASAVVNDLPSVVEEARARVDTAGVAERVEIRGGSYLEIDIEGSAFDAVVLGHVCRAEGEAGSQRLIARAWAALRPGGRLLLADYFADNRRKHNQFGVLMGVTMIASTSTGHAITHRDVHRWLADAGFESIRLLEPIAFNHVYVATKPEEQRDQ
jgi:SAM-dependent methyltransferase